MRANCRRRWREAESQISHFWLKTYIAWSLVAASVCGLVALGLGLKRIIIIVPACAVASLLIYRVIKVLDSKGGA